MMFHVVTKDEVYDVEADTCEIYEGKFIRLCNNYTETNTRAFPRIFGAARTVEVKATKRVGIALFPIERVILVTPMRVNRAASAIEAPSGVETGNTDSTEGESATAESGDAQ